MTLLERELLDDRQKRQGKDPSVGETTTENVVIAQKAIKLPSFQKRLVEERREDGEGRDASSLSESEGRKKRFRERRHKRDRRKDRRNEGIESSESGSSRRDERNRRRNVKRLRIERNSETETQSDNKIYSDPVQRMVEKNERLLEDYSKKFSAVAHLSLQ